MSSEILVAELPYPGGKALCAGGVPAENCIVAPDLEKGTKLSGDEQPHSEIQTSGGGGELVYPSVQAYFPLGCVACGVMCEAVYEVRNGIRTGKRPSVLSLDPEVYDRVRGPVLENLARMLLASVKPDKKDDLMSKTPDG